MSGDVSVGAFREAFPQFTENLFPDGRVTFWLSLAGKQLPAERWSDLLPEGRALFAAHHLTLERAALQNADGTGGLDAAAGPVTAQSKTVGGVSLSETRAGAAGAATADASAGGYNATIYGQQFWKLAMMIGMGGLQV